MESFEFLLIIALILLSTKAFGLISQKVNMPQVVGALIAGLMLGPSVLGWVNETDFVVKSAEIGVIVLMFLAGLETDLEELKKTGLASLVIATLGVIFPLVFGAVLYAFYFDVNIYDHVEMLKAVFIGTVLTATSVSITVETLREMGKLKGRMGTAILGAAILDDIIGIIVLTIVTSMTASNVNPLNVVIKIVSFFIFVAAVAVVKRYFAPNIEKQDHKRRASIYALVFCLILSYISEKYFGIADITGAYFAGIILCNMGIKEYIGNRLTILSYLFFSPVFFASIGIKTNVEGVTASMLIFTLALLIVAILTKILGCGLGAKLCKFDNKEALSIGIGMVSRGEVALIVAQKGSQVGLIQSDLFPPIVIVVIVTTLLTPILLEVVLGGNKNKNQKEKK